jgi:hypothetical protein
MYGEHGITSLVLHQCPGDTSGTILVLAVLYVV